METLQNEPEYLLLALSFLIFRTTLIFKTFISSFDLLTMLKTSVMKMHLLVFLAVMMKIKHRKANGAVV